MANIDMSELLLDPDFVDAIDIRHMAVAVGTDGIAVRTVTYTRDVLVCVQPASGDILRMAPEAARIDGALVAYSRTELRTVSDAGDGDSFIWRGMEYVVTSCQPWSTWGAGYYAATLAPRVMVPPA
jgi:hypothetical protein